MREIFDSAKGATPAEIKLAKRRKERGDPPGKTTQPLGDQITWEQFLSSISARDQVIWVISADGDFSGQFEKQRWLDPLLHSEITSRCGSADVRFFSGLVEGLADVTKTIGGVQTRPSDDEIEKMKQEESPVKLSSLPEDVRVALQIHVGRTGLPGIIPDDISACIAAVRNHRDEVQQARPPDAQLRMTLSPEMYRHVAPAYKMQDDQFERALRALEEVLQWRT